MTQRRANRWPQPLAGQQARIWYGGEWATDTPAMRISPQNVRHHIPAAPQSPIVPSHEFP